MWVIAQNVFKFHYFGNSSSGSKILTSQLFPSLFRQTSNHKETCQSGILNYFLMKEFNNQANHHFLILNAIQTNYHFAYLTWKIV